VRTLNIVIVSALIILLAGCSSRNNDEPGNPDGLSIDDPQNCSVDSLKFWANANMNDYYYFADQVQAINIADYDSPETLVRDIRVPPDEFSYVTTIEQYQSFFVAGETFAFGFFYRGEEGPGGEDDITTRVTQVYPQGPFGINGIVRGDIIVSLNGTPWEDVTDEIWTDAVGTRDNPKVADWVITGNDGTVKNISVARTTFSTDSVLHHQVFSTPEYDGNVGYLVFRSFIDKSADELDAVFADFANQDVQELILDLRYNGGGRTRIARKLASLIGGAAVVDQQLIEYRNNTKYAAQNFERRFEPELNSLGLQRLIVLTTGGTASSSEIVINSLKPYIDVVTIGTRSLGKPYISYSVEKCDRSMNALSAEGFNANGVSVAGGIEATCAATDVARQDFPVSDVVTDSSQVDSMMGAAIDYLNAGTCAVPATTIAAVPRSVASPPSPQPKFTINKDVPLELANGL